MQPGPRALAYFLYRYVLRLGFLDGKEGTAFHLLQGFWYRYLVDLKLRQVLQYSEEHGVGLRNAIAAVLGIELDTNRKNRKIKGSLGQDVDRSHRQKPKNREPHDPPLV